MSSSDFAPTGEQIQALDLFRTGENLVIKARAGTGKTTSLRLLAKDAQQRRLNGLYVAFNKGVQLEAARTFPSNIEARTANSLAFQGVPEAIRDRLKLDRQTYGDQAHMVGVYGHPRVHGMTVNTRDMMMTASAAVAAFCLSADDTIGPQHVTIPRSLKAFTTDVYRAPFIAEAVSIASRIWDDACSQSGLLKLTHDHILKMWAMTNPTLDYDFILYDEAQDADAVMTKVVQNQSRQLVVVGDSAQAIYGWRGAVDSLDKFGGNHCQLTQSWRFGQAVADEANVWLSALGEDVKISGNPTMDSVVGTRRSHIPDVVLSRTNGGVISQVIRAQERNIPVALAGKDTGRKVRDLAVAAGKLQARQWQSHPDLLGFKNWREVQQYVEDDPAGASLKVLVRLVDKHGADALVRAVDRCVGVDEARVSVTTAHTAKGLEWNHVRIDEDFPEPRLDVKSKLMVYPDREEMMLAYVSVTRAKWQLDPRGLEWIHTMPGVIDGPEHVNETDNPAAVRKYGAAGAPPTESESRAFDRVARGSARFVDDLVRETVHGERPVR